MEVIKANIEWDIGVNDNLWLTYEDAERDVTEALADCGIEQSFDECVGDGLISFECVEVRS